MVQPATINTNAVPVTNSAKVQYVYNANNQLERIIANGTTYTFVYDEFGKQESVSIGNSQIVSQETNAYNGKVKKVTYANGTTVEYTYDNLERVIQTKYTSGTNVKVYSYEYDSNGNLCKSIDSANGTTTIYKYNASGKLAKMIEYDTEEMKNNFGVSYGYDEESRLKNFHYNNDYLCGASNANLYNHYFFSYNSDESLRYMTVGVDGTEKYRLDYTYDNFSRYANKVIDFGNIASTTTYSYLSSANATSALISQYTTSVSNDAGTLSSQVFNYTYDAANQNITEVRDASGNMLYKYTYDSLDRLIREDNSVTSETSVYTYDNNGNLLSEASYPYTIGSIENSTPIFTYVYSYNNSNWKDQLTSYCGSTITYDSMGNPINYYNGLNFSWSDANRLTRSEGWGLITTYTYNDSGIRTSKTVGGVTHTYQLDGTRILSEEYAGKLILYIYDEAGSIIGMAYRTSSYVSGVFDYYLFTKNLQGDIIGIYDTNGNCVASYTYNAWGEHTVTNYTSANIGNINPFRYRGYYYDIETGFYYLNARYYDPQIKRFVSADSIEYLGAGSALKSYNLYAYCENNPISFLDTKGNFLCTTIGALVGGLFGAATALVEGKKGREIWASAANGAISGAVAGVAADVIMVTGGSGAVVVGVYAAAGALGSYAGTLTENAINGNDVLSKEIQCEVLIDAAWGGAFGALGGVVTGGVSSMMDDAINSAGSKRLAKGVTMGYAATKALKKELRKIGSSFIEEFLSNFNSWFTRESIEHGIGG